MPRKSSVKDRIKHSAKLNATQTVIINHPKPRRVGGARKAAVNRPAANQQATHHFHVANPTLGLHSQMSNTHSGQVSVITSNLKRIAELEKEVDQLKHLKHPTAQAHVAKAIGSLPPTDEQVVHSLNEYDARLQNPVVESSPASIIDHNSRVEPVKNIPDAFTIGQLEHNNMLHPDERLVDPFQRQSAGIKMSLSNGVNYGYGPVSFFSSLASSSTPATHLTEERALAQDIPPEAVQRQQFLQQAERARQAPSQHYMEADYGGAINMKPKGIKEAIKEGMLTHTKVPKFSVDANRIYQRGKKREEPEHKQISLPIKV